MPNISFEKLHKNTGQTTIFHEWQFNLAHRIVDAF